MFNRTLKTALLGAVLAIGTSLLSACSLPATTGSAAAQPTPHAVASNMYVPYIDWQS
jgi:hypothetical protein